MKPGKWRICYFMYGLVYVNLTSPLAGSGNARVEFRILIVR